MSFTVQTMLQVLSKFAKVHYEVSAVAPRVLPLDVINKDGIREDYRPERGMIVNIEASDHFI